MPELWVLGVIRASNKTNIYTVITKTNNKTPQIHSGTGVATQGSPLYLSSQAHRQVEPKVLTDMKVTVN